MKALLILLLLVPLVLAPGQRPAQPIRPIRISVRPLGGDVDQELAAAIRAELRRRGDVALVEESADYVIQLNGLRAESPCSGYFVAILAIRRDSRQAWFAGYAGPTPEAVARLVAAALADGKAAMR